MSDDQKPGVVTTKMKLKERFKLARILPEEGPYVTMRLVRELQERLTPDAKETEQVGLKIEGPLMRWDVEKDVEREFSFSGFELELIVSRLRKLDKEEKVTLDVIPLWEMFVDGKAK